MFRKQLHGLLRDGIMSIKIVITGFAVSMLSFLMATPTWAAYETKSRFKTDYKCVSDEKDDNPNYYGDSAVIAMGVCKPYYR